MDGRPEAVIACRTWTSAGSEPNANAIDDNAIQKDAAQQAIAAASESPQWEPLADAMTKENAFPLTGNAPEQESAGQRYLATIHSVCESLGVSAS